MPRLIVEAGGERRDFPHAVARVVGSEGPDPPRRQKLKRRMLTLMMRPIAIIIVVSDDPP